MTTANLQFATKFLVPERRSDLIRRQRLLDLLHDGIGLRAQVISAPAGYGKTTLLVDFASDIDTPVCWYSLDTMDQDPGLLLEGLVASIRHRFAEFGQPTLSRLSGARDVVREAAQIVGTLTGEISTAIPEYLVLLLEDYHFIEASNSARELLNLLVQRSPENVHLIISSRTPVELPALSALVVQRRAANYGIAHLCFTPEETRALLTTYYGVHLSDEDARTLTADMEGWVIGIVLAGDSAAGHGKSPGVSSLSQQDVFRYLASEVYDRQPAAIRGFLLFSSTLRDMEPAICDHLPGLADTRVLLRDIEKQNLFLQCIDADRAWYRYHHLFREFLQAKFLRDDPERFALMHCAAGSFFERNQRWGEAIAHFVSAKRYDEVLRVLKAVGEDLQSAGKWSTVSNWIEALPADVRLSDPDLMLLQAQSLVHLGDADEAARLLTRLLVGATTGDAWIRKAKALSWRSAAYRLTGHFSEAKRDVEAAVRLLEEHDGPADLLGDAYRRLGNVYADQGRIRMALKCMRRALKRFSSVFDLGRIADAHNVMGWLYKRLGDLDRASMHLEKAREGWQKTGNPGSLAATLNNIAYIYQRRGQYELALDTLGLGLEKARAAGYKRMEACLLIAKGEVLRDLGLYSDALAAYQEGLELARQVMEAYYVLWAKAGIGETYRLIGDNDRAEVLLREAISEAEGQGQTYEAAMFTTQLGIIEYERRRYGAAMEILSDVSARLSKTGDKDALAKSCFHLAQALFLARKYDLALEFLEKVSALADELGYDEFLAVEGRNAVPLLRYGAHRHVGKGRLFRIIRKVVEHRNHHRQTSIVDMSAGLPSPSRPDVEAYALGEARVEGFRQIDSTEWTSNKAKEMFFYMLCHAAGQTKEEITAALWPDLSPGKARSNFHINLYRIRRAVFPGVFLLEHGRYRLDPDLEIRFDVDEFERMLSQASRLPPDSEARISALERAAAMYGGPFMPGFYSEWVETRRRDLEDKYVRSLSLLATHYSNSAKHGAAIAALEKLIATDPYQDEVYGRLMECHLASEDRVSALRVYGRYLDTVVGELGLSPSPRISGLHNQIVAGQKEP